jgi:Zn-finger nucleic acid-binding protein
MQPRHEHGIEIDTCASCGSAWFDRGELEARRAREQRSGAQVGAQLRLEPSGAGSPGACPRCAHAALQPARAGKLELASCPACRGAFVPAPRPRSGGTLGALDWLTLPLEALGNSIGLADLLDLLGAIDL